MIYKRSVGPRMGSHRRMFSRRSVVGLVFGILLGFNLASWLALPAPSRTNIEIEVVARDRRHRAGDDDIAGFRVEAARIRRNKGSGVVKIGKNCDHDVVEYKDGEYENQELNPPAIESKKLNQDKEVVEESENERETVNLPDEFDLEEERLKRQKELEVFYESDVEAGDENDIAEDVDGLEDFQFPRDSQKYVDYGNEFTSQSEGRDSVLKKRAENWQRQGSHSQKPTNTMNHNKEPPNDRKHFIYVGVLTAQKYLATRGRAIMDTWANDIPGKVEFFVGEGASTADGVDPPIPLVQLPTVKDDAYPPQKKSFFMLKRMYDAYVNSGYQWFMRADDDVYVKNEKLEEFLRNLNSSQPVFLGQTGLGNAEERGRLSLPHGDNYCMGGPGMIFSREVLRRVGPHIKYCLHHLYSWHEDVELSRCIRRFADVNCAWSYQMQELFYEHYTLRKGYIDPYIDPNNLKLYSAFTLHPNKNPQYQVKLHKFMMSQKLQQLFTRIKELSRDVVNADRFLGMEFSIEDYMLGITPSLHRFIPRSPNEVQTWDFMTERLWYSAPPHQARRALSTDKHIANRHIVKYIMQSMNANSKTRGRIIDFNQVAYGYRRVNPLYGAEYVLDLLLTYKRFKGKRVSIPVRRHAYLQQTFTKTVLHEQFPLQLDAISTALRNSRNGLAGALLGTLRKHAVDWLKVVGLSSDDKSKSQLISLREEDESLSDGDSENSREVLRFDSGKFTSLVNGVGGDDVRTVHIIVPLKGRFETFCTFMTNLEKVCLSRMDPISLIIILFTSESPEDQEETEKTTRLLNEYSSRYPDYDLRIIPISGAFSRGLGLEIGSSHFSNDSLLFFCDIDVVFDTTFTSKCRANAICGQRVYYPILFSEFHPNFSAVWDQTRHSDERSMNPLELQNVTDIRKLQAKSDHFEISDSKGYWRNYGFGLLCTYKRDFAASGGFDIAIQGWGMEDVDLVDKFVKGPQKGLKAPDPKDKVVSKNTVDVFRTPESSLVHVYHPSHCDPNLSDNQLRMCRASRASGVTSLHNLVGAWSRMRSGDGEDPNLVIDPVSMILPLQQNDKSIDNIGRAQDIDSDQNLGPVEDFKNAQNERTSRSKRSLNERQFGIR